MRDDFTSDGILILRSPTFDFICGGDATLDLHDDDGNVVLRIAFRRETNKILFNTGWEEEERVDFDRKSIGADATVTICDHRDRFQILINYRTVHYFKKRLQDGNVSSISYLIDVPNVSPFREYLTLTLDTYSCLANLLPRSD